MRRTIHKIFPMWAFDKEERWLNEMSAKGLQLRGVGFCKYVFEEGLPGEYIYRLEILDNLPTHAKSVQYIRFIEDTGAERITSVFRWVYFRKKADGNGFDLFSDIDSRIKHLNRILVFLGVVFGMFLINGLATLASLLSEYTGSIGMIFTLFGAGLIGYGLLRVFLKRRRLKKEKILHE